ncbi:3-oxoacyl-[acyl-carrier-protein] synthase III C-terminal domain-containing protein [Halobacteriaceae archaeon GCM10025711]
MTAEELADAWGRAKSSGIRQTAVPDADEDALTMAYEAATRALDAARVEGEDVAFLALGSTTLPYEEEDLVARLASMLGVPETAATRTQTGSTAAGVQALDAALDAGPWLDGVGLVVASDCPRGAPDSPEEHAAGAGAAAFVVGDDGPASVTERATYTSPYPGTRFRRRGETGTSGLGVTEYDRDAFADAVGGAVGQLDTDDVDAVALQAPDGKLPYRVADRVGVPTEYVSEVTTVHSLGDTGAASAPLALASALDGDADRVLVCGYGSGGTVSAMVVEAPDAVPSALALDREIELSYAAYLRRRGDLTDGAPEGGGAYVSVPSWRRTIPQRHRLVAGRCRECGTLAFPPEGACTECGAIDDYDPVELPGTGTVEAATTIAQGGAPPEFVEQQEQSGAYASVVVAFDGPGDDEAVSAPAQVVPEADPPAVGDAVTSTIRRIYEQEGVLRYGFKVLPAGARR